MMPAAPTIHRTTALLLAVLCTIVPSSTAFSHTHITSLLPSRHTTMPRYAQQHTALTAARKNDDNDDDKPSLWNKATSSQLYRTLLLTGALFSSPKIRSLVSAPVLLVIFLAIWGWYVYDARFNELADVVGPRRQAALQRLRQGQAQLLSSSSSSIEDVEQLKMDYELALRKELEVRVIVPGIWRVEMYPEQEDYAAARQFLKMEITDDYRLEPME